LNTRRQNYTRRANDTQAANLARKLNDVALDRVLHETWDYYDNCAYRQRNGGLFTADQDLGTINRYSSAIFTRQNADGTRYGYECPEERDYYPYWQPNGGWRDIAVLNSDASQCSSIVSQSFNVKSQFTCIEYYSNGVQKHWSRWNNQVDCIKNGGNWTEVCQNDHIHHLIYLNIISI
jgi:hypothetical protein